MGFFILVLVVGFIAAIVGVYQEISPIIGPSVVIGCIITAITLIVAIINNKRK